MHPKRALIGLLKRLPNGDATGRHSPEPGAYQGWSPGGSVSTTARWYAVRLLSLAIVYWLVARLGLAVAVVHASASPVWAPAGIAVGALVVGGRKYWPGVFVGALAANVAIAGHWPSSILIAVGNTAEALIGAWAIGRWCGGKNAFDNVVHTVLFVALAAIVAPLSSSLVGVGSLAAFGLAPWSEFVTIWGTWYLGDALGIIVVAPAILLAHRWRDLANVPVPESIAYPLVLIFVGLLAFGPLRPESLQDVRLGALALPVIAWAAIRLGPLASAWSTLTLAVMAVIGNVGRTVGPVSSNANLAMLELQGLLGLVTLFGLSIAAVVHQRASAFAQLASANDRLEHLVEERTRKLRSAVRGLHEAQELAGLGSWNYNAETDLFSGSPWLHRTFDVATAAPLSKWTRHVQDVGDEPLVDMLRTHMSGDEPFAFATRVRIDGKIRHLQFTGTLLAGRGWHGTCQDISTAREAEAAARRLAVLVDANPLAIIAADADGVIETWNDAAEDLLGYSATEAIGKRLDFVVPPEDQAGLQELRARIMQGGHTAAFEGYRIHKDGTLIPVFLTLAPFEDPEDGALRLMAILRDRRPELAATEAADEARRIEHEMETMDQLTKLKSEFINMASHELRTPLTPIRVQLHLLKSGLLDQAGTERSLVVMERNMVRLSQLVEDVFAAARLQSGGFAVSTRMVDFAALLRDVVHTFDAQAQQHGLVLDVRIHGDTILQADPDRLTQVLFNLLGNAMKYAPEDSMLHVDLVGGIEQVRLAVEDEGPGVDDALRSRLFEPFGRLETDSKPGTGLGLYISKGIAELHGGRIRLAPSRFKHGARFEMVLPKNFKGNDATEKGPQEEETKEGKDEPLEPESEPRPEPRTGRRPAERPRRQTEPSARESRLAKWKAKSSKQSER